MIGTLANVATIVAGSLMGGLFRKVMNDKLSGALMDVMGLAAFGLGINAVVQNMPKSTYPVLFIVSLAIGCLIGTLLDLDGWVAKLTERKDDGANLGQGIITGCLIFCIGTLSILGPVQSALYGDHTYHGAGSHRAAGVAGLHLFADHPFGWLHHRCDDG